MSQTFFKIFGQKTVTSDNKTKIVVITVLDEEDFYQEMPDIFEMQGIRLQPTVYTGSYPTIKFNMDTVKDRSDLKGSGLGGIVTKEQWYTKNVDEPDLLGINISEIKK